MLDNLVQRALENNRDVAVAASRVEEARQNLGVVRAQFLPQVGIGVTAEGEYTPQTKIVQTYAVEPSLSWEIALFGQLRNAKRAARAQIASSEWALRGVRLSLAAEVATTYFTLLEYERDLAIARRSCTLRRESAALIDSMFRYGMSDGVALEQARSLVYTAEADIPQYERAVKQTRLSLDILLGETPQAADSTGSHLKEQIQKAQILRDDLAFMIDRAENAAGRLETQSRSGNFLSSGTASVKETETKPSRRLSSEDPEEIMNSALSVAEGILRDNPVDGPRFGKRPKASSASFAGSEDERSEAERELLKALQSMR